MADASAVLASIFPDEAGTLRTIEAIRDTATAAPATFPIEIANAILVGLRRKRLTERQATAALRSLGAFDIEIVPRSLAEIESFVLPLAVKYGLTIYDALYLDLAKSRNATLHSVDRDLCRAARAENVRIA